MLRIEVKIFNKNNIFMFIYKCVFYYIFKKWFLFIVIENNINFKILLINLNKYICEMLWNWMIIFYLEEVGFWK